MQNVRLRSANRGNANNAWNVNTTGNANNNNATNANRPCPDCERRDENSIAVSDDKPRSDARSRNPCRKANNTTATLMTAKPPVQLTAQEMTPLDCKEEDVIGEDALMKSMRKCVKGVLWKDSVAAFYHRSLGKVYTLSQELRAGTYKAKPPVHFTITHPKPRSIASVAFRDRVYQRSLNDNIVYPLMTRSFVHDNYACQKGKGTDAARNRLKEFLRQHYRKHGPDGWVLQVDIHGYYPNMRHDVAEQCFREKLPEWAYRRVETILREQYGGAVGYDPGSQLVQIAGISTLDKLDHYVKETLRVHHYIRYMDDLILIDADRERLEACKASIGQELAKIGFAFNPDKTRVYPLREGILFLGFRFRLTDMGKALMQINPKNVKAERRKLRRLVGLARKGFRTRDNVDASYQAWRQHASKGNSWKLLQRMDAYYKQLWEVETHGNQTQDHDPG